MGLGVMRSEKNYQTIVNTALPPVAARETRFPAPGRSLHGDRACTGRRLRRAKRARAPAPGAAGWPPSDRNRPRVPS